MGVLFWQSLSLSESLQHAKWASLFIGKSANGIEVSLPGLYKCSVEFAMLLIFTKYTNF